MNKKYQYSIMYFQVDDPSELVDGLNEINDGEVFQVTEYSAGLYIIYIRHIIQQTWNVEL